MKKNRKWIRMIGLGLSVLLCLSGCGGTGNGAETSTSEEETQAIEEQDTRPMIALTFDDGPHTSRTGLVVDELAKYGFHATFFVVGNRVDGSEYSGGKAMQYAVAKGNEIGIHGYTHGKYYDTCTDAEYQEEISKTAAAIDMLVPGYKVNLMRPVGGRITEARAAASPYSVIMWDIDSEDWRYKYQSGDSDEVCADKVNTIVNNVMSQVHEGGIILMHDIYESTYDAAVIILQKLHEQGYRVVTVSELLGANRQAGQTYSNGIVTVAP